jgi:D-apiose dehydrogenase
MATGAPRARRSDPSLNVIPAGVVKQFRVALVGLGNAGDTLHLPALSGVSGARIVGGFDTDQLRRERAAARWGINVFESFDDMVSAAAPDVIVISTPSHTHADYCFRSLRARAHVICERPFTTSVDEANQVIEAARVAQRSIALHDEFREMPIFRAVREVATRPGTDVSFAQAWQFWDRAAPPDSVVAGRARRLALYDGGVHLVEFLIALFGEKPLAVSASISNPVGGGDARAGDGETIGLFILEFSGGRLAQIIQNLGFKGEAQRFEVRAETGLASLRASLDRRGGVSAGGGRGVHRRLRVEFGRPGIAWQEIGRERTPLARNGKDSGVVATRAHLEQTLEAFSDGGKPPATAEDGRDVLEVIAASYHAATTGRRVVIGGPHARSLAAVRLGALDEWRP